MLRSKSMTSKANLNYQLDAPLVLLVPWLTLFTPYEKSKAADIMHKFGEASAMILVLEPTL